MKQQTTSETGAQERSVKTSVEERQPNYNHKTFKNSLKIRIKCSDLKRGVWGEKSESPPGHTHYSPSILF